MVQAQTDVGWAEQVSSAHNYGAGDADAWAAGAATGRRGGGGNFCSQNLQQIQSIPFNVR